MSLRSKVLLILASVFLLYGGIDFCIQRFIVYPGFLSLENEEALKDSKILSQAIDREIHHLDTLTHDWSSWDDTYDFVKNRTKDYIQSNLVLSVFTDNNLNLLYIIDQDGSLIWGEVRDLKSFKVLRVNEFDKKMFPAKDPLINYNLIDKQLADVTIKGIYTTEKGPMLVTSRPILNSDNEGPIRGSIIMGRFLNEDLKRTLARQTRVDFEIYIIQDELTEASQAVLSQISKSSDVFIKEENKDFLGVYSTRPDIQGKDALLVKARIRRSISAKGWSNIRTAIISIVVASIVILIVVSLLLQWIILNPTSKLTKQVLTVKQTGDLSTSPESNRKDELGTLQREFNRMLEQLLDYRLKIIKSNETLQNDVKHRQKAEEQLKASEEIFRSIIESSPMGLHMYRLESNNRLVFVGTNPAANRILGVDNSQFIGMTIEQAFPSLANTDIPERYRLAATEGIPWQTVQIDYEDDKIQGAFEVYAFQMTPGNTAVLFFDITERKHVEDLRRKSDERYRMIFEGSSDAIFVVELETGFYLDANNAAERLTGRSVSELKKLTTKDVAPHQAEERLQKASVAKKTIDADEVIYIRPDGSSRIALLSTVLLDKRTVLGIAHDITERKKTQELMVQTEKMMSVGGLAAGMAHELNNPLGAILQSIQIVQQRLSPDLKSNIKAAKEFEIDLHNLQFYIKKREITTFINAIKDSGKKAAEIISSMLQFSRKSESNKTPSNLAGLLENVLELAGKDYDLKKKYDFRNIKIIKEFDAGLPLVPCAETEIGQVVLNLLKNATHAMIEGSQHESHHIIIRLLADRNMARIEIEDNGPGMEESVRKRIFEPFFTTKPVGEGTGLGLSVSYMIITNNHKGTMEAESEPGKGTRFIIRLPLDGELT